MTQIIIKKKAQEALDFLVKYKNEDLSKVLFELNLLERYGREYEKLKSIGNNIKRIRCGRWRILCNHHNNTINVRIIAMEKDTKKDYDKRKTYIIASLKL